MRARPNILIPAALIALVLAGCGISDPYTAQQHASTSTPTAVTSTASPNDPSDPTTGTQPPGQLRTGPTGTTSAPPVGAATPVAALAIYARLDANWSAQTLGTVQRKLAAISVGQARANALQAAASYGRDTVLLHSQVRNTGTVIAITPSDIQPGVWVVVTQEHTIGQGDYSGLPAQLHVTYARVTHTPTGDRISSWSTQT